MNFSQKSYEVIRREIVTTISVEWKKVDLIIMIAVKDVSLAMKGTYTTKADVQRPLDSYGDGWDLGDILREWYLAENQVPDLKYRWNKIQFEIDHEGYAVVTSWDQEYYDYLYPNG